MAFGYNHRSNWTNVWNPHLCILPTHVNLTTQKKKSPLPICAASSASQQLLSISLQPLPLLLLQLQQLQSLELEHQQPLLQSSLTTPLYQINNRHPDLLVQELGPQLMHTARQTMQQAQATQAQQVRVCLIVVIKLLVQIVYKVFAVLVKLTVVS